MLAKKHIYAVVFCLAAFGLSAEGMAAGGPSPTGSPGPQQNKGKEPSTTLRRGLNRKDLTRMQYRDKSSDWDSRAVELLSNGAASLPEMRAKLAEEWQRLGIPAEQAKMIASTYRGADRRMTHTQSLEGKSATDVAGMMQAALASKDYRQANLLLIDYERARLNLEPIGTSKPGAR